MPESFCHGCPVGTKTTSSSRNRLATSLAATRCPWWIGSNVPPMMPTRRGSGRRVRTEGARVFLAGARTGFGAAFTAAPFTGAALAGAAFTAAALTGAAFTAAAFAGAAGWDLRAGTGTGPGECSGHQGPPQVVGFVHHAPPQRRRDVLPGEQLLGPLHCGLL